MKKNIIYVFSAFIAFFMCSCEGDLDPKIYGQLSPDNTYQTEADLQAATTALYYELRQKGWGPYLFSDGSYFIMEEGVTDIWTTKWAWDAFLKGAWHGTEEMAVGFYNRTAPNITRCTFNLAKMEESSLADDIKKVYIAEVKALRAFFMFDLYRYYGPMPMILDNDLAVNPDPDYRPSRPSAETVEEFVKTELRSAADDLPVVQTQYGRITKGAALHYLLKYHMFKKEFTEARDIANEIIGLGYYKLEENYANIFSAQNEGNRELIFVVRAEPLADYGNHAFANILPGDYASPHGNAVDGWNGHRMPWKFYDTFEEGDKRRDLAVAEYTNKSGEVVNLRNNGDIGALPLKYGIDPDAAGIWAGNDKVLDRYAEVLLFKAEALNEISGPNQESIDLINEIRRRGYGAGVNVPAEIILKEEFDTEVSENLVGAFTMSNFDQSGASKWVFDVDKLGVLSGDNSMHVYVENSGAEFWTLQIRADHQPITKGRKYSVSFQVKATKDITFSFRSEGPLSHTEDISLKANEIKQVTCNTAAAGNSGESVIFFALGNTGVDYDIWIDNVVFTALEQAPQGAGESDINLVDFSSKEELRDWILKERGWEFWYEGKRRGDLIRMGKYMEVGQSIASDFGSKNLLFPIPTHVLVENPNIKQNTGY